MAKQIIAMRTNADGEIEFTLSSDEVLIRALETYRDKILAEDNELTPGRVEILMIPEMIEDIRNES